MKRPASAIAPAAEDPTPKRPPQVQASSTTPAASLSTPAASLSTPAVETLIAPQDFRRQRAW
eukprot:2228246-Alexandrium_andersonii.AAC.1